MKSVLRGLSQLLLVIAGFSFFVGGRAISEFAKIERMIAEVEGIGLAVVCGVIAFVAKTAADNLDKGNDTSCQ